MNWLSSMKNRLLDGGTSPDGNSKTIGIGTDVAALMLFHPGDLQHAVHWPIAWYADHFVYPVESGAGRLVAWFTGGDGGFEVRLTDGDLTSKEKSNAGPRFEFPITVQHGRIFLDNSDGLPGMEQMDNPDDLPDRWYDLPNGDYIAEVVAIVQPKPEKPTLPDYVVRFRSGDTQARPKPARRPPDLLCLSDASVSDEVFTDMDAGFAIGPAPAVPNTSLPCVQTDDLCLSTRQLDLFYGTSGETDILHGDTSIADLMDEHEAVVFLAPEIRAGGLGMLARMVGSGGPRGLPNRYMFQTSGVARIKVVDDPGHFVPDENARTAAVQVEPVAIDGVSEAAIDLDTFKAELSEKFQASTALRSVIEGKVRRMAETRAITFGTELDEAGIPAKVDSLAAYAAMEMNALTRAGSVTAWALATLPLPAQQSLELAVTNDSERIEALLEFVRSHPDG